MSVCFFVPADTSGASTSAEDPLTQDSENKQQEDGDSTEEKLAQFWTGVMDDIKKSTPDHFKSQVLPLARIKKIMKLDEEVKMISSEAPVLFAKAAEIFIHELTLRAWAHTCDNKRRTLQRNDIAMAISKSDQFDFLIDIVPRHEAKPPRREDAPRAAPPADQYYLQLAQQHQSALQSPQPSSAQTPSQPAQQQIVLQTQPYQMQQQSTNAGGASSGVQQPVTIVQQIVASSGEVQPVPIQLTQAQLNMIRLQMQSHPNQPIIIQTQQPQPQIIQVSSQAQQQPQQVYLAQVSQESDS